jgi:hypothetical protein
MEALRPHIAKLQKLAWKVISVIEEALTAGDCSRPPCLVR